MPLELRYDGIIGQRGVGFWLRWPNVWASREDMFRTDESNEWRYSFGQPNPPDRSVPLESLLPKGRHVKDGLRIIILADTGEGDRSQYGLVPLLRSLKPDFMVINGDLANPAGRINTEDPGDDDFQCGFFHPYRHFPCAIWATPGNHEYYSPDRGLSFYQVFCTRTFDNRWDEAGLPHKVVQPGTYWEVSDLDGPSKMIIIGLDSGATGNLDGDTHWWSRRHPDSAQLEWLNERLGRADAVGGRAVVLFHIPPLSCQTRSVKTMRDLQQAIASHPCVKAILCGHEHNHQQYTPARYRQYLQEKEEATQAGAGDYPHYIICGGGGSALHSTDFPRDDYPTHRTYPTAKEWNSYADAAREVVNKAGLNTSIFSFFVTVLDKSAKADDDACRYRSLMVMDIDTGGEKVVMKPVFLDDVVDLFNSETTDKVDVLDENPPVMQTRVDSCFQNELSFQI